MTTAIKAKDKRITIAELTNIANDFLQENYGLDLNIPIERNNRLSRAMGRFLHNWEGFPVRIELAGFLIDYANNDVIIDTLKHELIHYALYVLDKPHNDGNEYFENELRRQGVSSTGTNRVGMYYIFSCDGCSVEIISSSKRLYNNPTRYTSRCCNSKMTFVNERIYDGTEVVN